MPDRRRSVSGLLAALALGALATGAVTAEPGRLTEARIRAFVERQERTWNGRKLDAYFAAFTHDAVFVDQTRTAKGALIRYGDSDLAQAKAQSRRYFARATVVERNAIDRVEIAPDGVSARVRGHKVSRVETRGRRQAFCAETEQTLVLARGRILSRGQTDTTIRCRAAGPPAP